MTGGAPRQGVFDAFGVGGIPHTIVLGANGIVASVTHPMLLTPARLERALAGQIDGPLPAQPGPTPKARTVPGRPAPALPARAVGTSEAIAPIVQLVVRRSAQIEAPLSEEFSIRPNIARIGVRPGEALALLFDLEPWQVDTSNLPDTTRYDLLAWGPAGLRALRSPEVRNAVLADLGAVATTEQRSMRMWRLAQAEEGHRLVSSTGGEMAVSFTSSWFRSDMAATSMITDWISRTLDAPVEDETGLAGYFFRLDLRGVESASPEAFDKVLREQAGLRLVPVDEKQSVLVVHPVPERETQAP
jgi:uncharacterized protein (TIGR03435 family)